MAPLPAAGVPGLYAPPLLGVGLSKKSLKIQNSLMGVESGSSRWSSLKPRAECGGVLWRDRSTNGPPRAAMQKEMLVDGVPAGKRKSDLMSRRAE